MDAVDVADLVHQDHRHVGHEWGYVLPRLDVCFVVAVSIREEGGDDDGT